jgi:hypothetical protein
MNTKSLLLSIFLILFRIVTTQGQINFGERALGAI